MIKKNKKAPFFVDVEGLLPRLDAPVEPLRGMRGFSSSSVCEITPSLNEGNRLGFLPAFAGEGCTTPLLVDIDVFLDFEG